MMLHYMNYTMYHNMLYQFIQYVICSMDYVGLRAVATEVGQDEATGDPVVACPAKRLTIV